MEILPFKNIPKKSKFIFQDGSRFLRFVSEGKSHLIAEFQKAELGIWVHFRNEKKKQKKHKLITNEKDYAWQSYKYSNDSNDLNSQISTN